MPRAIDQAFNEMTTAYANWRTPIINYFEEPTTNAYTGSVNSLIRELDRVGRGYSFDTMRALMLHDETVRTKKTSTRRDRPPIPDDAFGFIDFDGFSDPWSVAEERSEPDDGPDIRRLLARLALEPDVVEQ